VGVPSRRSRLVRGGQHAEVRRRLVRHKASLPTIAGRPVKHQHLPPAVGLRCFNQVERNVGETVQALGPDKLADELVVLFGCGVISIWAFRVVGMPVVGARDKGDPEA
jgi:hypothetical protein